MNNKKNEKSFEELADEALDAVSGGKSVIFYDCVRCHGSAPADNLGPDGNYYCTPCYEAKWPSAASRGTGTK